ncbi:MAG TPA: MBL fold metallo-hydrolase [Symbiobacteriaceae bacterium]|nr:MBL fold metallo-hydrolase [Symbiobacteriaceae bacterium]
MIQHTDTCHVYVLRTGREALLIDCGDGSVLDRLAEYGVDRVTDVLMTHHHRDQGQGLARLAQAGARIWVPEAEQDLFRAVDAHWQAREIYNSYNNREDRFSLLEPVPVAGVLRDYHTYTFGGRTFEVIPTPGHTTGSITLVTDGMAFVGDLIAGPGKVWSLAATQWSYNGGEGIPGTILSLLTLKDRSLGKLLPSHGEVMDDPQSAIDLTVERLAALRDLRRQNPRLFLLREQPYEAITPHLLKNRTSMSNAYVLLSQSGKALLIDFGYDFMFGPAAGADRASRRPWLYTIPALKQQYGVTQIDAVVPTHYHDDHIAGCNVLRAVEGAQVWAGANFADILEHPADYDLPCLWYDPIPVDRVLPLREPIQWEEYELTLHPLPGHTLHAVAISVVVDGKRVVFVGDQWAGSGDLNYVYKNRFESSDYLVTAELLQELRPDLLIGGHWDPVQVTPEYLSDLRERGARLAELHHSLLAAEPVTVLIQPYQAQTAPGVPVTVTVRVPGQASVRLVVPAGWSCTPDTACGSDEFRFTVVPPLGGGPVRRARIAADVTLGERRLGQIAEALITVANEG